MSSEQTLAQIRDLTIDYITDDAVVRAVDNVSFDIKRGEAFGLAGESGCGKSTVAFALARLTRLPGLVSGGQISFEGQDVLAMTGSALQNYRWNQVSFVFQSAMNALNPVIKVSEQILDVIAVHKGGDEAFSRQRAIEMFNLVGIHPARLDDYPHQFSGGMRQRICIAIALCLQPKLIIMDEPTTALDVVVQRDIIDQINALKEKFGFSILFISHDLGLMVEFCDRIGVMYAGELVEINASETVFTAPHHPYTIALGSSFPPLSGERRRLEGIGGVPPSPTELPSGCRFHPRCERAIDKCKVQQPELSRQSDGGLARCLLLTQ